MPGFHYNFHFPCKESVVEYHGPYIEDIVRTIRTDGADAVGWSHYHIPADKLLLIQVLADRVANSDAFDLFIEWLNTYACWNMVSICDKLEHPLDLYNVMEVFERIINDNDGEIDESYILRKMRVSQERAKSLCEIIGAMCVQDESDKVCSRIPYLESNKDVLTTISKLVDHIAYEPEQNINDYNALCVFLPTSFQYVPNIQWVGWKMNKSRKLLRSDLGSSLLHMIFMYGTSNTYQKFYDLLEQWIADYESDVDDVESLNLADENRVPRYSRKSEVNTLPSDGWLYDYYDDMH